MRGRLSLIVLSAVSLSGCWGHVFPQQTSFPMVNAAAHANVFADANGTLYPSGWDQFMKPQNPWKEDSLLNEAADDPAFLARIRADGDRQLDDVAKLVAGKQRVFILVHGYNNKVEETTLPYDEIERRIAPSPSDAVIRLNWDGLWGSGAGPVKIWFNATGNSQLVGMHALRSMLSRMADKDIYVIGHSRGASVLLSALSDPPFDPKFKAQTMAVASNWPAGDPGLFTPPPLAENGNRIRALLLAPAVDRIDFCLPGQVGGCEQARSMSKQLCSIRYTVNPEDRVLKKFVGLQGGFNPTRLGQDPATGQYLKAHGAGYLRDPAMYSSTEHGFATYVASPQFDAMLKDMLAERTCG